MIRKANELDKYRIAEIIAFAYKEDFNELGCDLNNIAKGIESGIIINRFFVYELDGIIAGITAISDITGRATNLKLDSLVTYLGHQIGKILYEVGKEQLGKIMVNDEFTAYIEFVAVDTMYRGSGIARKLINYIIENTKFNNYILDVKDTNLPAIKTYLKIGFIEYAREKVTSATFNEDIFMRYVKKHTQ